MLIHVTADPARAPANIGEDTPSPTGPNPHKGGGRSRGQGPPTADILALHEVEIESDGTVGSYRTHCRRVHLTPHSSLRPSFGEGSTGAKHD